MYCWRIRKDEFWEAAVGLRKIAYETHPAFTLARKYRQELMNHTKGITKAHTEYMEECKTLFQADVSGLIALQLFDEGDTWLCRCLTHMWRFEKANSDLGEPFESVFYDGRVGEGSSDDAYEKAMWMDKLIDSRQYLLHMVLETDEPFSAICWGIYPSGISELPNSGPPKRDRS